MFQTDDLDDILTEDSFSMIDRAVSSICTEPPPINEKNVSSAIVPVETPKTKNNIFVSPETPSRYKRKRKFPGPAGLLPDEADSTLRTHGNTVALSQNVFSQNRLPPGVFDEGPWNLLERDIDDIKKLNSNLRRFSIENIKNYTNHPQLSKRKVPLTAGAIQSIDRSLPDPSLVISDTTGEIQCTLHRDAWESFSSYLTPNFSCITLVNCTILTAGSAVKKKYLNITLDNISAIHLYEEHAYPSDDDSRNARTDRIRNFNVTSEIFRDEKIIVIKNDSLDCVFKNFTDSASKSKVENGIEKGTTERPFERSILDSTLEGVNMDFLFDDFN